VWTKRYPSVDAGSKDGENMAYDIQSTKVIIYGDHSGSETTQTWAYDYATNNWTDMNPATNPGGTSHSTMVYDTAHDRVLLFNRYTGATWSYDHNGNTWTNRSPTGSPPIGSPSNQMGYDPQSDRTIMIVRSTNPVQTWSYSYTSNTWTRLYPTTRPPPDWRGTTNFVYLPQHDRLMLIDNMDNRMWSYDYESNNWSQRSVAPSRDPTGGAEYRLAHDSQSDRTLWYGDDRLSWSYDWTNDTWTNLNVVPNPEDHHGNLVYVPTHDRIIFYGGCRWPPPCPGERFTWEFDFDANPPVPEFGPMAPSAASALGAILAAGLLGVCAAPASRAMVRRVPGRERPKSVQGGAR
jgi:hypothetical protein